MWNFSLLYLFSVVVLLGRNLVKSHSLKYHLEINEYFSVSCLNYRLFCGILMDGSLYLSMFTAVMDTVSVSSLLDYVFIVATKIGSYLRKRHTLFL